MWGRGLSRRGELVERAWQRKSLWPTGTQRSPDRHGIRAHGFSVIVKLLLPRINWPSSSVQAYSIDGA